MRRTNPPSQHAGLPLRDAYVFFTSSVQQGDRPSSNTHSGLPEKRMTRSPFRDATRVAIMQAGPGWWGTGILRPVAS
jgi:hypothetical protein